MKLELVRLFAAVAAVIFIGWNILSIISAKRRGLYSLESLALSYGLGLGFISYEMLLFYFLRAKFNLACIMAPWLALFLYNMISRRKSRNKRTIERSRVDASIPLIHRDLIMKFSVGNSKRGHSFLAVFLGLGVAFETFYAFFRALIKPLESYDSIAIYAIKSKILYLARSIPQDFFTKTIHLFPHPDYPLNIPLGEVFVYLVLGRLNDQLVKVIFPLYFAALLVIMYFSIRRFSNRNYALLFTFFLASLPQVTAFAANGYLEVPLAFYCFASAIFLLWWFERKEELQYLILSATFAALAGWTKNDGLMYCVTNMFLLISFLIFSRSELKWRQGVYSALYLGVIFLILFPWLWIKRSAHIVNSEIVLSNINPANLARQLYKFGPILYEFQKQFFGPKKWNILWPAALFVILANYRKAFEGTGKYIALSLFLTVSGYVLFYLISYVDINFFLAKSWSRFLIHFLPLVIYWMARTLKDDVTI